MKLKLSDYKAFHQVLVINVNGGAKGNRLIMADALGSPSVAKANPVSQACLARFTRYIVFIPRNPRVMCDARGMVLL